ncbi:MAG TPA: hypothetical protein VHO70_10240, partial [Chitinispirillaceae bacterium]|nr:hypothetical protein [Chitinispirillaceae bacterium]
FGGKYTVKRYHSIKEQTEDGWSHSRIVLKPNSFFTHYTDIILEQDDLANLKVVGELVAVLG